MGVLNELICFTSFIVHFSPQRGPKVANIVLSSISST